MRRGRDGVVALEQVEEEARRAIIEVHQLRKERQASEHHRTTLQAAHDRMSRQIRADSIALNNATEVERMQARKIIWLRLQIHLVTEQLRSEFETALAE